MGFPDALLFTFLALGDALLIVYLRLRRQQRQTLERMARSLHDAIEREIEEDRAARHRPALTLPRAS